jgi:hypothetical protein
MCITAAQAFACSQINRHRIARRGCFDVACPTTCSTLARLACCKRSAAAAIYSAADKIILLENKFAALIIIIIVGGHVNALIYIKSSARQSFFIAPRALSALNARTHFILCERADQLLLIKNSSHERVCAYERTNRWQFMPFLNRVGQAPIN